MKFTLTLAAAILGFFGTIQAAPVNNNVDNGAADQNCDWPWKHGTTGCATKTLEAVGPFMTATANAGIIARHTEVADNECTNWPWKKLDGSPCAGQHNSSSDENHEGAAIDNACTNWPWKKLDGSPCAGHQDPNSGLAGRQDASVDNACTNWPWKKLDGSPCAGHHNSGGNENTSTTAN